MSALGFLRVAAETQPTPRSGPADCAHNLTMNGGAAIAHVHMARAVLFVGAASMHARALRGMTVKAPGHLHFFAIDGKVLLVTSVAASSGPLGRRQRVVAKHAGTPENFSAAHMARLLLASHQAVALGAEKHTLRTTILRGASRPRQGIGFRLTVQASRGLGARGATRTQVSACFGVPQCRLRCLALLALALLRTIFVRNCSPWSGARVLAQVAQ